MSHEITETHLILKGPGTFDLGMPWYETVKVEEGKQRRRKLPADGEFMMHQIEPEEPEEDVEEEPVVKITRTTKFGAHKRVQLIHGENE